MRYILDTHSLVWYFVKDKRLSSKVRKIIREGEKGKHEIIIPAIVLLEAIDIQEKKKVSLKWKKFLISLNLKKILKLLI
jgi:PIN domain nuclease of toxin-antitoxin system